MNYTTTIGKFWGQASQVHKIIISFITLLFITNKDLYYKAIFQQL